jgi:uncharacterized OB-fold protein
MAEQAQAVDTSPRPIVPFLKLQPKPHLMGSKCGTCGAVFIDTTRIACSKCGATEGFKTIELSDKGKVYVFSVVHQSFPGINPEDAQKNPKQMFDMPVEMVTSVVAKDREGHEVVAFSFKPSKK